MDLRSLHYFTVVAEELNITRAAERLNMSQPPLSNQIKGLEEELGVQLFIRGKRHLTMTEAGALLYRRAKQLLELSEQTQQEIRSIDGLSGDLNISLVEGRAPYLLARWIAGFRSEYHGVISIDVSEWVGHFKDPHFLDFLKYLVSLNEDVLYVFTIPSYNPQAVEQLTQLLVLFFRIQPIEMTLPSNEELGNYIKKVISDYGLNLDAEAEAMIVATVNRLRDDQYFAGYDMLDRLASDIVYSVYTSTPPYDGTVSKGMISAFAPDGIYVTELIQNNARIFTAQFNY